MNELPKSYLFNEFLNLAERYNNSFAKYLKKELAEYFIDQDPSAVGDFDAINNGIDDAFNDSMGDSLEPDLELEPTPAPTLKLNRLGPLGAKEEENKGYSWQEIDEIIEFSQQNDFWKSNILSAQKLRKQVIVLENQMQRNGYQDQSETKMDMLAELYAEAKEGDLDG